MKLSGIKSAGKGLAKAATKLNQGLKEQTAKGKAPDPHLARVNRPCLENLKAVTTETVREAVRTVANAVKSTDFDR